MEEWPLWLSLPQPHATSCSTGRRWWAANFLNYFLTISLIPESWAEWLHQFHRIVIWLQAMERGASRGSLHLIGGGDESVSLSSWWDGDIQAHTDYQPLLQVLPHCSAQTGSEPADGGFFVCLFFAHLHIQDKFQNRSNLKLYFGPFYAFIG